MSSLREIEKEAGTENSSYAATRSLATQSPATPAPAHVSNRPSYLPSYYESDFEDDDDNISQTFLSPRSAPNPFDSVDDRQAIADRKVPWMLWSILTVFVALCIALVIMFAIEKQDNSAVSKPSTNATMSASRTLAPIVTNTPHGPAVVPTEKSTLCDDNARSGTASEPVSTETLFTTFGTTTVSVQVNVTSV